MSQRGLGDVVESALSSLGVTKERVSAFLGRPCNCPEYQRKLNQLSSWAYRVASGYTDDALQYLYGLFDSEVPMTKKWQIGVTTVPERIHNGMLSRTLASLKDAGFDEPRLFVDGWGEGISAPLSRMSSVETIRQPAVRPFGNWWLGLVELWIRDPNADLYAMIQDDVVFSKNARQFLDKCQFPTKGYWNLYTETRNGRGAPNKQQGWYVAPYRGKGALALVFDKEGLQTLLMQKQFVERPLSKETGFRNIDGGVVNSMNYAGWKEFIHSTSLCQHIGKDDSAIKKIVTPDLPAYREWPLSDRFRGEEFDCLELEGGYLNGQP